MPASPRELPQSLQLHNQFVDTPNVLQDVSLDFNRSDLQFDAGGVGDVNAPQHRSAAMGGRAGTSLLAQQLAEHSASIQTTSQSTSDQLEQAQVESEAHRLVQSSSFQQDNQTQQIPSHAYLQNQGVIYGANGAASMGSHHSGYVGYLSTSGAPLMMSSPSNFDSRYTTHPAVVGQFLQNSSGSYGSHYDGIHLQSQYTHIPHHISGAPPPQLVSQQISEDQRSDFQQNTAFRESYLDPPPPPPRPPYPYRGMSM